MDKNFFNTIMKKENRWKLVISLLALILIYICISFFLDDLTLNKKASANVSNEQNQNGKNQTVENYEAQQKTDLKNILKKTEFLLQDIINSGTENLIHYYTLVQVY